VNSSVKLKDSNQEKGKTESFAKVSAIDKQTKKRGRGRPRKNPKNHVSFDLNQLDQSKSSLRKIKET